MKKLTIWLLVILILVFLSIAFVIAGNTIKIPYTGMIAYTETVPINKIEKYEDTEPYTDKECTPKQLLYKIEWSGLSSSCIQYECASYNKECSRYQQICSGKETYCVEKNFWGNCIRYADRCISYENQCVEYRDVCSGNKCVKYRQYCGIKIINKDTEGVTFNFRLFKYDNDERENKLITTSSKYISGMDEAYIHWQFDYQPTDSINCNYELTNTPTKQVCENVIKTRKVTKERTVVGQEEVQKQEEVVKYHTLFEALGLT